jgi:hypothetical protein
LRERLYMYLYIHVCTHTPGPGRHLLYYVNLQAVLQVKKINMIDDWKIGIGIES